MSSNLLTRPRTSEAPFGVQSFGQNRMGSFTVNEGKIKGARASVVESNYGQGQSNGLTTKNSTMVGANLSQLTPSVSLCGVADIHDPVTVK